MALFYAAEIPHIASYNFSTPTLAVNNSKTALVAGGWTVESMYAWISLVMTGNPTNGQTVTLKDLASVSYIYTFVTTLVQATPRQIKIGATLADTLTNTKDAINALPATSGTAYSNSTTADANWTATTLTSTTLKVQAIVAGPEWASIEFFAGVGTWVGPGGTTGSDYTGEGGWACSTVTPDGLRLKLRMFRTGNNVARYQIVQVDESDLSTWLSQNPITSTNAPYPDYAGTTVTAIVTKQTVIFMNASSPTSAGSLFLTIPAMRPYRKPITVLSIANVGGLIEITTNGSHGWSTGASIYIANGKVAGAYSASINGQWVVTRISATQATLNGSSFPAGSYDASSAIVGDTVRIAHAYVASKCYAATPNVLTKGYVQNGSAAEGGNVGVNAVRHNSSNQWLFGLWFANVCGGFVPLLQGVTNVADFYEARLAISLSSVTYDIGMVWDAFTAHISANVGDALTPGPNGKTFRCVIASSTTPSVWVRTSA